MKARLRFSLRSLMVGVCWHRIVEPAGYGLVRFNGTMSRLFVMVCLPLVVLELTFPDRTTRDMMRRWEAQKRAAEEAVWDQVWTTTDAPEGPSR